MALVHRGSPASGGGGWVKGQMVGHTALCKELIQREAWGGGRCGEHGGSGRHPAWGGRLARCGGGRRTVLQREASTEVWLHQRGNGPEFREGGLGGP